MSHVFSCSVSGVFGRSQRSFCRDLQWEGLAAHQRYRQDREPIGTLSSLSYSFLLAISELRKIALLFLFLFYSLSFSQSESFEKQIDEAANATDTTAAPPSNDLMPPYDEATQQLIASILIFGYIPFGFFSWKIPYWKIGIEYLPHLWTFCLVPFLPYKFLMWNDSPYSGRQTSVRIYRTSE